MYYSKSRGFTIVELLIVIVVIGILAAIVIVAYNGVQNRAVDSSVQSDLVSLAKKLEIYKIDSSSSSYPSNAADMTTADIRIAKNSYAIRNNLYYCRSSDGQHYAVGAVSKSTTEYMLVDGAYSSVSSNSVNAVNTCLRAGATGNPQTSGYDQSSGTGWAAWAK